MLTTKINDEESSIERDPHDAINPYFLLSRSLARNKLLSLRARGMLVYLLSFSDKWKFNVKHISKDQEIGRDSVYAILDELIEQGYCRKTRLRDESGKLGKVKYTFSESPKYKVPHPENTEMANLKEKVPHPGLPDVAKPDVVFPTLRNKEVEEPKCIKGVTPTPSNEEEEEENAETSSPSLSLDMRPNFAFEPQVYILRDGGHLSIAGAKTVANKMKKDRFCVLRGIKFYEEWCDAGKTIYSNHEKTLLWILKEGIQDQQFNVEKNKLQAEMFRHFKPNRVSILKTVVQIKSENDREPPASVRLDMHCEAFGNVMRHHLGKIVDLLHSET